MKISKNQLAQLIKEEYGKLVKTSSLKKELEKINEELSSLKGKSLVNENDEALEEVEAGGLEKTKSAGWSGVDGDAKYAANFQKKGSHLMEDDEMEGGDEEEIVIGDMGLSPEEGEGDVAEMGEFESQFAEVGRAIDSKIGGMDSEEEIEVSDVEVSDDSAEEIEVEEEEEEEVEDINAMEGVQEEVVAEEVVAEEVVAEDVINESPEEPLEGHSVAQDGKEDTVNDNMSKDTHVKEGEEKEGKEVLSEGKDVLGAKSNNLLKEELNRMRQLTKLFSDED